jgi:hypothetical protein
VQHVFKAVAGKCLAGLVEYINTGASLWNKHGPTPRLWSVAIGEIENMAFSAGFSMTAEYGKCYDALSADPVFQAWPAKSQESGVSEWVRSNLLREMTS